MPREGGQSALLRRKRRAGRPPLLHTKDGFWDPIWRVCEEAGLPVCLHIGSSGFMPIIDPQADFSWLIAVGNMGAMLAMVNLLLSGVCDRFPKIKMVWSEAGIGWIPSVLERCDRQVDRNQYSRAGKPSSLKPSEIFQRNMFACIGGRAAGHQTLRHDRENNIVAETDYPHADTPFPYVQKAYSEVFEGIPRPGGGQGQPCQRRADIQLEDRRRQFGHGGPGLDRSIGLPPDFHCPTLGFPRCGRQFQHLSGRGASRALFETCGKELDEFGHCEDGH